METSDISFVYYTSQHAPTERRHFINPRQLRNIWRLSDGAPLLLGAPALARPDVSWRRVSPRRSPDRNRPRILVRNPASAYPPRENESSKAISSPLGKLAAVYRPNTYPCDALGNHHVASKQTSLNSGIALQHKLTFPSRSSAVNPFCRVSFAQLPARGSSCR